MSFKIAEILGAIPLVTDAMEMQQIKVSLTFGHWYESKKEDNVPLRGMAILNAVVNYKDETLELTFYVDVPVPNYEKADVWAWMIADSLRSKIFSTLSADKKEVAIEFYDDASDAVYELMERYLAT